MEEDGECPCGFSSSSAGVLSLLRNSYRADFHSNRLLDQIDGWMDLLCSASDAKRRGLQKGHVRIPAHCTRGE